MKLTVVLFLCYMHAYNYMKQFFYICVLKRYTMMTCGTCIVL